MALIQDTDTTRINSYIRDPQRVIVLGYDVPADIDPALEALAAYVDEASNSTQLSDDFIGSFVTVADIEERTERRKQRVGNLQQIKATMVEITSDDPRLAPFVVLDSGKRRCVIVAQAGRRRIRGMRLANERNSWEPTDPQYIHVKLDASRSKGMTTEDAMILRLLENAMRSSLDLVAEGQEILRVATIIAAEKLGREPTAKEVKREVTKLAQYTSNGKGKPKSAESLHNKTRLAKLTPELQALVSDGTIAASSGYELGKLAPELQAQAYECALTTEGKCDLGILKAVVRSIANENGDAPALRALKPTEALELASSIESKHQTLSSRAVVLALKVAAGKASVDELNIMLSMLSADSEGFFSGVEQPAANASV